MSETGELEKAVNDLKSVYANRLNAGLPLTLEEWGGLSDKNKEIWEECFTEYRLKNMAMQAHILADTLNGGTIATDIVWDILPEETQARYLNMRSKENAKQNELANKGSGI